MRHSLLALVAIAVMLTVANTNAQSGYDLFQKALASERADGDLRVAIQLYESVVKQFPGDRPLVARALIRIAECQEKLGERDAAKVYERIVREFADQADSVTVARARLSALQAPALRGVQAIRKIWSDADVDPMGSPSADGRFLSFTNWATGDLGLRDVAAGTNRLLTNTGGWESSGDYAEGSVLSPDGSQVAYAWFIDKGSDPAGKCVCRYELRVMSITGADAGKPRVMLRGEFEQFWAQPAAWTPDGKGLIVVRSTVTGPMEIGVMTVGSNTMRVLKTVGKRAPRRVSISPDGQVIAFDTESAADPAVRDIVMRSLADGRETMAVQDAAHDHSPLFTSDGSHLLFLSNRTGSEALWRLPLTNGRPAGPAVLVSAVASRTTLLGATRSGSTYYFGGGPNSNVYSADLDDNGVAGNPPRLLIDRFLNTNMAPAFSPDGQSIAYLSQRGSTVGNGATTLVVRSLQTASERELAFNVASNGSVSWFPDSRSLLAAVRDTQENRMNYQRIDASSGEQQRLMSTKGQSIPSSRPQVSPDGKTIFFADRIVGPQSAQVLLARFDIATAVTTTLATFSGDQYVTSFAISPDGTEIAQLRFEGSSRSSICEIVPANGGPAREIFRDKNTGQARFSGLAWSRDRRHIMIVRDNNLGPAPGQPGGALWRVPVAGGAPVPVGISMPGMVRFATLDPSGKRVAFAAVGGDAAAIWAIENFLPRK